MKIIEDISRWVSEYNGIFTFCLHSDMDELIYSNISKQILDMDSNKNKIENVSYLKSLPLKNSLFELDSNNIFNPKDFHQNNRIIQFISESCFMNNNSVLLKNSNNFKPMIKIMEHSNVILDIKNGKMSITKSRYGEEHKDIDMLSYIRDIKIDIVLQKG